MLNRPAIILVIGSLYVRKVRYLNKNEQYAKAKRISKGEMLTFEINRYIVGFFLVSPKVM